VRRGRWRRTARHLYTALVAPSLRRRIAAVLDLRLPGLCGLGVGRVVWLTLTDFYVDDMPTYAAALAFHLLLALFPFIILLLAVLSLLHLPSFFEGLGRAVRDALPAQEMDPLAQAVQQVRTTAQEHRGVLSLGILGALWTASAGMRALMHALNVAYDVTESRPLWQRYLLSLAFTLLLTAVVITATGVLVLAPEAMAGLAAHVGLDRAVSGAWIWLRLPVALLLLMLAVALVYYVAPNCAQTFQVLTPGAVLAVVVWLSASLLFSAYVTTLAHYSAKYGSIGAIVVLLLYFYITALALLLGAEINAVLQHYAPRPRRSVQAREARAGRKPRAARARRT
jgi:membrane protein